MTNWKEELNAAIDWMTETPTDSIGNPSWVKLTLQTATDMSAHIESTEEKLEKCRSALRLITFLSTMQPVSKAEAIDHLDKVCRLSMNALGDSIHDA